MAIVLNSQKTFREARKLKFCYLCCREFAPNEEPTGDHVPPEGIFDKADRNYPLILPAHEACNVDRSKEDQVVTQLLSIIQGRIHDSKHRKLNIEVGMTDSGNPYAAVKNLDLRPIIRRWVRGFHAALYKEPLPETSAFMTCPPLPTAKIDEPGKVLTGDPVPEIVLKMVPVFKKNRALGSIDRITSCNGKCIYECVWTQLDGGRWVCFYCLDLYGWSDLGDGDNFDRRSCVGLYYARERLGVPVGATTATRLLFSIPNEFPLDAFRN